MLIANVRAQTALRFQRAVPLNVGEWLSLVEHLVRDQGVGGSNPLSPTNYFNNLPATSGFAATSLVDFVDGRVFRFSHLQIQLITPRGNPVILCNSDFGMANSFSLDFPESLVLAKWRLGARRVCRSPGLRRRHRLMRFVAELGDIHPNGPAAFQSLECERQADRFHTRGIFR